MSSHDQGQYRLHLPPELIARISSFLPAADRLSCLLLSTELYHAVLPILYSTLIIDGSFEAPLGYDQQDLLEILGDMGRVRADRNAYFASFHRDHRFWDALRHVRHIQLSGLPSAPLIIDGPSLTSSRSQRPLILPHLHSISLLPPAVDALRLFSPTDYSRSLPPFLRSLIPLCAPSSLCISFRLLPSTSWEEHRDITLSGAYQLVARLRTIGAAWPSLRRFEVHDIVHQVLPSLGCMGNVFHFAPHIVALPRTGRTEQGRYTFRSGTAAVGLPGPQWSERSWQISQSIKTLFPSSASASASAPSASTLSPSSSSEDAERDPLRHIVDQTQWTFVDPSHGILTKRWRDDDDESGVGVGEVQGMIEQAVRDGLRLDLGAREGFELDEGVGVFEQDWHGHWQEGDEVIRHHGQNGGSRERERERGKGKPRVGEVLRRITYVPSSQLAERCTACGRKGMQGVAVSDLSDIDPDYAEGNGTRNANGRPHSLYTELKLPVGPRIAQFATDDMYSALMDTLQGGGPS